MRKGHTIQVCPFRLFKKDHDWTDTESDYMAKILTLDIENAPADVRTFKFFNTNISLSQIQRPSYVLGVGWKWLGGEAADFYGLHEMDVEQMRHEVWLLLDEADIVVTYNGNAFDLKKLNWEFEKSNMPEYSPVQSVDLYRTAKRLFLPDSRKLDFIASELGLGSKLPTSFDLWNQVMDGDADAWERMAEYCKQDVELTEALYLRWRGKIPGHPTMSLYDEARGTHFCPQCGADALKPRGYSYTAISAFQRYRCSACGKWSRSGSAERRVSVR